MNHEKAVEDMGGRLVVAVALTATGCSSNGKRSDKPETSGGGTPSAESSVLTHQGQGRYRQGRHRLRAEAYAFESLDPANNYFTNSQDVGRLIYPTLTFIKDTPGEDPSIQPDLAETLGHYPRRRTDLDLPTAARA